MNPAPRSWFFRAHLLLLHGASALVPAGMRAEWRKEWAAELWYIWGAVQAASHLSLKRWATVSAFCRGAFVDAFWLRRNSPHSLRMPILRLAILQIASPARCISFLAGLLAAGLLLVLSFPDTRNAVLPEFYGNATTTMLISRHGFAGAELPTVRIEEYENWRRNTHAFFAGVAFYQPIRKPVRIAPDITVDLNLARATPNLFQLLDSRAASDSRIAWDGRTFPKLPALILSQSAWRAHFSFGQNIIGQVVRVGGEDVTIAGVVPDSVWRLPGRMDAWLFYDDQRFARLPRHSKGFVLARWRESALAPRARGLWGWHIPNRIGSYDSFECVSLAQRRRAPWTLFLTTFLLALLALPATTSLALGDYPSGAPSASAPLNGSRPRSVRSRFTRSSFKRSWFKRLRLARFRRWIFLSAKLVLIVPAVYFVSLDFAHFFPGAQFAVSFIGLLLGFRWAWRDQRNRCPVCLRLLKNPARVGQPSWNFLAWSGTELICEAGHGLLHVPELSTSWFSTQRWVYLDPSWECLFPATVA
jgi:hypothetical protein